MGEKEIRYGAGEIYHWLCVESNTRNIDVALDIYRCIQPPLNNPHTFPLIICHLGIYSEKLKIIYTLLKERSILKVIFVMKHTESTSLVTISSSCIVLIYSDSSESIILLDLIVLMTVLCLCSFR